MTYFLEKCEIATLSIDNVEPSKIINQEVRQVAREFSFSQKERLQQDNEVDDLVINKKKTAIELQYYFIDEASLYNISYFSL